MLKAHIKDILKAPIKGILKDILKISFKKYI